MMIWFPLILMVSMQNAWGNPAPESLAHTEVAEMRDAIQAVIEGCEDFFRNMAIYSPSPAKEFHKSAKRSLYFSDSKFPLYNGVFEENLESENDIQEVIQFFKSRQCSFCWWTSSQKLQGQGFELGGTMKGVALDISQGIPVPPIFPSELKIEVVKTEAQLDEFCRICTSVPGMGPQMVEHYKNVCSLTMKHQEQMHFLGYLKDIPVASLTLTLSDRSAGIWNAVTLTEYRKMGIFTALVHRALWEAKERQYDLVTALLMPKGMAWGVFQKMGFEEVSSFPFYLYGFDPNTLEDAEPK